MCLAVPGKIQNIISEKELYRKAMVDFAGIQKEVNLTFVPEANVGDYVIVHVGMAISVLNEEEAQETLGYFEELAELEAEADKNS